ncbi:cytochrome P450 [Saccharopolyspora cebuensis]|uniref:Cytochrome P450 n=1 Tax=Saccharopolyspora cebuensis TaxID=418759 RepID=A0ABV4CD49_9PSEU
MTTSRVPLPTTRSGPFDPPAELGALRARTPVAPLSFPDGTAGWLVTGHEQVRAALLDPRFSARQDIRTTPPGQPAPPAAAPGFFVRMDPPEHTRYRRMLQAQFTPRRMELLAPRIERITHEHLDAVADHGPPTDLVPGFAVPVPSLVICELLGVPYPDREVFQRSTATALDLTAGPDQVGAALSELNAYLGELVVRTRREPGDHLLGGLVRDGDLTDAELTAMAFLLLVAGHETTANMLALGVLALLAHPDQLAALRAEPALADDAVEELLRYLTIMQFGAMRVALEDFDFGGARIAAGEAVVLSLPAANRDPARFRNPEVLDLRTPSGGHLAFGHGAHHCLGHQLARLELRIGYTALLHRFPELRLAEPVTALPMRHGMSIYGVHRLPVAW